MDSLKKRLGSLPASDAQAAEAILKELDTLGTVTAYEAKDKDGKKVWKVDPKQLQSALDRLTNGLDLIRQQLAGKTGLLNQINTGSAVVINTGGQSGETLELTLTGSYLAKLEAAGIALKVRTADATANIAAGTSPMAMNLSTIREMNLRFAVVDGAEAQSLLSNAGVAGRDLKPAGNLLSFTGYTLDNSGNRIEISAFNKPIMMSLLLSKEEMQKLSDKRKSGVYQLNDNGDVQFRGGKFGSGAVSFDTTNTGNYAVMESNKTFKDSSDSWAKTYIEILVARGVATGIDDERFAPQNAVTRGQLTAFLGRALQMGEAEGTAPFSDVAAGSYYQGFIIALKQAGIVSGYEDGTFRPDQKVTREEMLTMVMKGYEYLKGNSLAGLPAGNPSIGSFADEDQISSFALDSVQAARNLGMIGGLPEGKFAPQEQANRDQVAKVLVLLMEVTGQF